MSVIVYDSSLLFLYIVKDLIPHILNQTCFLIDSTNDQLTNNDLIIYFSHGVKKMNNCISFSILYSEMKTSILYKFLQYFFKRNFTQTFE